MSEKCVRFQLYCSHVNLYDDRVTGLITYGAVDTQNCDALVDYVPLTKEAAWQFEWDG